MIKLLDGKCWMTQNLKIENKHITPSDSNTLNEYTLPNSNIGSFKSLQQFGSAVYIDPISGGYYAWNTATAGEGKAGVTNTKSSICPKHWKLPSQNEYEQFVSKYNFQTATAYPAHFTDTHWVNSSGILETSQCNRWWGATGNGGGSATRLHIDGGIDVAIADSSFLGYAVRCIFE